MRGYNGLHMLKRFVAWPFWGVLVVTGLVAGFCILFFMRTQGGVRLVAPLADSHPVSGVIKVELGREVAGAFSAAIEPAVTGKWRKDHGLFGVYGLEFVPDKPLVPASVYLLKLTHLHEVTGRVLGDQTVMIETEIPPAIESVNPAANAVAVFPGAPVVVKLRGPNR